MKAQMNLNPLLKTSLKEGLAFLYHEGPSRTGRGKGV